MATLVLKSWKVDTKPIDANGNYVDISGRHVSHFFCLKVSTSRRICKHIENGVHIFRKERSFLGVV